MTDFKDAFKVLTSTPGPFPWQIELYQKWFANGEIPDSCNLPTGMGKTAVVVLGWL